MKQSDVSNIVNGRRISPKAEERIAAFFGKQREELFPLRSRDELEAMRVAEAGGRKAA